MIERLKETVGEFTEGFREHPEFANISVGAKHDRSKSLVLTNNLSAVMLRPYKIGMLPGFISNPLATVS